jgi:hypothetical protein
MVDFRKIGKRGVLFILSVDTYAFLNPERPSLPSETFSIEIVLH